MKGNVQMKTDKMQDHDSDIKRSCEGKRSKTVSLLSDIFFGVLFFLSSVIFSVSLWYDYTFDIKFSDLLFTMMSPLDGTGKNTIKQILSACAVSIVLFMFIYIAVLIFVKKKAPNNQRLKRILAVICALTLPLSLVFGVYAFKIPEYLKNSMSTTNIYELEYIDPNSVKITDHDNNARNLIYIYLESMETTYASTEVGGKQQGGNYMPNLTQLANDNVSFSDSKALGGFRSVTGTGWTMGALMSTTSGVPFSLAVFGDESHNSQGKDGTFANGLTTIGDILEDKGYNQEFLCGSDSKFAGRDTYFKVHGNYKIFDYYTAIEKGYIDEDYYVFWGFEDKILFDIAKDEITDLASQEKPFNFTMLTVDLHHVGGYKCDICGNEYSDQLANIVTCQDRQVNAFIEWCKNQDFYENTTIVIVGDHPRMDKQLIGNKLDIYDRTMYNCIINSAVEPSSETTDRTFTSLDMFPTTLAAMGFELEGERLGLGTNLLSTIQTLCEKNGKGQTGYNWLCTEVSKHSDFYKEKFVGND